MNGVMDLQGQMNGSLQGTLQYGTGTFNQSCGQIGHMYQSCHCYYPQLKEYINVHSDVAVNKAENGFILTIKGKQYIAALAKDIPALIEEHLK